jgi:hypothetical protein
MESLGGIDEGNRPIFVLIWALYTEAPSAFKWPSKYDE